MKNKGITLIALVITIVVLIILAGVAISLTLGDNGIFNKAITAKEDYGIAAAKEQIELKVAEIQAEKEGKATLEELVEYLKDDPNIDYTVALNEITASLTSDITVGDANEIYVVYNSYQFKVKKNMKVEYISKVTVSIEDDYEVPYTGVGYEFIYDGTQNSSGNKGNNMCNAITDGWTEARTTYSCDNGACYLWYHGCLYTNNKINLTGYSKLYVSSNIIGNESQNCSFVYGGQVQKLNNNIIHTTGTKTENSFDFYYGQNGKKIGYVDIPQNWEGYIGTLSEHSTSNVYTYQYNSNYMRNYCDSTRYIDTYEIVALKEDNWEDWAKIAKVDINSEENNTLDKILQNTIVLSSIFNNEKANSYLLKCSGTLMMEILRNDTAFNSIPDTLKTKMKDNTSWSKFATICNRSL